MIISRRILLEMRSILDKSCRENQNTYFMFNNYFPTIVPFIRRRGKLCRAGQATDYNIIQRMRIGCWITKATNIHSENVILIFSSPRQQWLRERASVLGYVLHGSDQRARTSMRVHAIGVFCVLRNSDRLVALWRH